MPTSDELFHSVRLTTVFHAFKLIVVQTDAFTVITHSPTKDASEPYSPPATSESSGTHSSNASLPSTPLRGRSLYPTSRVPLHRRGTSNTYERLEDLLREAGYKETRVFTPESERHKVAADTHANSVRGGVGAVVGFLAGLVSRNSSLVREVKSQEEPVSPPAPPEEQREWSQPPSPLAQVRQSKTPQASSSTSLHISAYSFNTSQESLRKHSHFHATSNDHTRPRPRKLLAEENVEDNPTQHHTILPSRSSRALPHQSHAHLHHRMRNQTSFNSPITEAPKAHAYLRHMASAPNIQPLTKRPSSNVSLRSHRPSYRHLHSSHRAVLLSADDIIETDDVPQPPPLPRNWMESVAKALLSGVTSDAASIRTARKASSALTEATNMPREPRRPPLLCAQVREQRARTSQGTVSRTSVMCRSAPASRAGSRVRRSAEEDKVSRNKHDDEGRRKGKREEETRKKGKGKGRESDVVPSLARTRVENDEWGMRRYLKPTGHDDVRQETSSSDGDLDDDEDEEGELDLERLLVPARRQASIRSLRKHLHPASATSARTTSPSGSGRLSPFTPSARLRDWPADTWGTGRERRWVVGEEDDDEGDGYGNGAFSGSEMGTGTRAGMKRRRGLPGTWAQWGS